LFSVDAAQKELFQSARVSDLIEKCREHCHKGARPSAEEAMALIGEIDRLRQAITRLEGASRTEM
jgi:hypothetical protein